MSIAFRHLGEMFLWRARTSPERIAFEGPGNQGRRRVTWAEAEAQVIEIAEGLLGLGLEAGGRVAILARPGIDWVLSDLAVLLAGACTVPLHLDASKDHLGHALKDSGAQILLVEDEQVLRDQVGLVKNGPRQVVVVSGPASDRGLSLAELRSRGRVHRDGHPGALADRARNLDRESLATIVYTAGTSGLPKGVALTHGNLLFEIAALRQAMQPPLGPDDVHLLCLPLSHILARATVLAALDIGYQTALVPDPGLLAQELKAVRPTFMTVVPLLLERLHGRLARKMGPSFLVRHVFESLVLSEGGTVPTAEGEAKGRRGAALLRPALFLARAAARRGVRDPLLRQALGGRLKLFICGGAALAPEVAVFFFRLGLPVLEGYGLTETTGAANVNRPDRMRIGSVGPPLSGVEQRIAPDGEILIRGGMVMSGYHRLDGETRRSLDREGWLHTGDLGRIDVDGFLWVTGRKKDILVTAGGKNISPQNIEALMQTSPYIEHFLAYGDGKAYLTGLVALHRERVKRWAEEQGLPFVRFNDLVLRPELQALVRAEIEERNQQLAGYENVRRFLVTEETFTLEAEELTPTLKLRRQQITDRFRGSLEALYDDPHPGL